MLGTFVLVAAFILVQQVREAAAEQDFHAARAQVIAAQARASELGLEKAEFSDLQRQELTTASETPPLASAPFNEDRIAFFSRAASQEVQIKEQLQTRVQKLLVETRDSAQSAVNQLSTSLQKAKQIGVDDQLLVEFAGWPSKAQIQLDTAANVRAYRAVSNELKARVSKLSLMIADQETTNKLIDQYAAQAATQNQGDAGLARAGANAALAQVQADMQIARIFSMDVSIVDLNVQKLAVRLNSAATAAGLEQVTGGLMVQEKVLTDAMTQTLPEKAITISLSEQVIRAYEHGKQVFWSYTTTGRPGLETDPGSFKVYWKVSPWTMHSPWPKGSPYWYPDSKVQMVMWFNGGDGIHDAYWRSRYGPGTNGPHYDPTGEDTGTHGCVNVPYQNMVWLWNWTPTGTPVIVY
ncbi:MAG TPA: L,D-transpeptidase family protein [Candidatus Binatus sp.]|nr:L,D-transpeptidase family protein [Candidatus Binatus sp.]